MYENNLSAKDNKIGVLTLLPIFLFMVFLILNYVLKLHIVISWFGSILIAILLSLFLMGLKRLTKINLKAALKDPFWGNCLTGLLAVYFGSFLVKDCSDIELMKNQEMIMIIIVAFSVSTIKSLSNKIW